ncbi:MAG: M12 family metallo-peptidase [Bryobacteraceae bacterium]
MGFTTQPAWMLLLLLLTSALRAQTVPSVFVPVPMSRAPVQRLAPEVKRARPVELDYSLIDSAAAAQFSRDRARSPAKALDLNLFDAVTYRAQLDQVEYAWDQETVVWSGRLAGTRRGQVLLAVTGEIISGTITTDEGKSFQIRNAHGAVHWVEEMDFSKLPRDGEPRPVFLPENPLRAPEAQADDGSLIDVLVVYTSAARQAVGGTTQMNNLIALGVAETNQGYANSGVIQRVRLVNAAEVSYTESGIINADLDRLTNPSDGFMDEVHALRDAYAADVVSLWVNSGDACGLAWLMATLSSAFASQAFSVVRQDCATGYYSFGHEMGHNMGSVHNQADSPSQGVFPYSYGYQQKALVPYFRTIMAYECTGGVNCPRLNFWSSPNNAYSGIPTGVSNTDNVLSLNNTRDATANFRQSRTAPTNPSPSEGAVGVSASPTLRWTGGGGATSHDVFFGTSSSPPFVTNTTATS